MSEPQELKDIPQPSKGAKLVALIPLVIITGFIASFAIAGIALAVMNAAVPGAVIGGLAMTGACGMALPHLTRAIEEITSDGKDTKPKRETEFEVEKRVTKSFGQSLSRIFKGSSKKKMPKPNIRKTAPKPPKV